MARRALACLKWHETLREMRLRCTALDRALLLASDDSGFLQVIGQAGDTTHELTMVAGARGTFCNEVSDGAAGCEHGIGHASITAINDDGGAYIGIGALILIVRHAIPVVVILHDLKSDRPVPKRESRRVDSISPR